jgi:hypothetical protein
MFEAGQEGIPAQGFDVRDPALLFGDGMPRVSLPNAVRKAVNAGLCDGCKMSKGNTWEIDALVGLFRVGLPALDIALQNWLPGIDVRIGGVFCHGRPKVTIDKGKHKGKSCEIGDLLLVVRYMNGPVVTHQALLLQTKIGTTPQYPGVKDSAYKQLVLYTMWPEFTFFGNLQRDVKPKGPHPGAQYGFLDICNNGCPSCNGTTAIPPSVVIRQLEATIVDMVFQTGGRQTTLPPPPGTIGWDRVVWDLLLKSVGEAYHWTRGKGRGDRAFRNGLFLMGTGTEPPQLLEEVAASADFAAASEHSTNDFSLAGALSDERLSPPGSDDDGMPGGFDDDPDRGLSVAVVEIDATQADLA